MHQLQMKTSLFFFFFSSLCTVALSVITLEVRARVNKSCKHPFTSQTFLLLHRTGQKDSCFLFMLQTTFAQLRDATEHSPQKGMLFNLSVQKTSRSLEHWHNILEFLPENSNLFLRNITTHTEGLQFVGCCCYGLWWIFVAVVILFPLFQGRRIFLFLNTC